MESNKKKKILTIIRIAISILLLAGLIRFAEIDKIVTSLKGFDLKWLPLIFLLIILSVVVSTFKWRILIEAQDISVGFTTLFGYYMSGLFFNNFLPSSIGGDGVRIYLAGKKTNNLSSVASSVIVERVLATVTLALLGIISSIFAHNPSKLAIILLIVLLIFAILLAWILLAGWIPEFLKDREAKIIKAWISFSKSAGELKNHPKELGICLIESMIFQIIVALVIWAVMKGLNLYSLPLADLFLMASASSVLAMVPVGLNGYGMREGAYIYLLQPFGYTSSQALTVSVLFALFVSLFSLFGGISWIFSRTTQNKINNKVQGVIL
ncbi:MAG: lysylphosphatidylglycerol synthase transmembrane domain-containing protein [Clostridiaceae bacterium]